MSRPPDTYTHGHHESVLRSHKWRTAENSAAYLLPHLKPGMRLLDVGCGPGTITIDLARRVAPGQVIGLDRVEEPLESARTDAVEAGVDNVTFQTGDAYALPFDDDSFDVVHAHQVLQHLTDPVAALREMRRVCRPGGIVAARDSDYAAKTWFPAFPLLDRWMELYQAIARGNHAEPNAGRRMLSWGLAAGFDDITPSAATWCFATPADREWWGGLWADRVTGSAFADQVLARRLADRDELERIAAAWRDWASQPDGWYLVVHGEILCRV
jgi:SAM-dependent methyltransferase